jgi:hypothetical protein
MVKMGFQDVVEGKWQSGLHINIQHHYVTNMVAASELQFLYFSKSTMWANVLTKGPPSPKHITCIEAIGLGKLKM